MTDDDPTESGPTIDGQRPENVGPDRDEESADGARRGTGRVRTILTVLLAVALICALALAGWQTQRLGDLESDVDRRADAARTAGEFTLALLSYDFESLDDQTETIADLATEDFATEFSDAMDRGLGASITELRARSEASVSEVMVSEVPGDRARAVVIADSEITSEAGNRASTDTYLDVSLIYLDDRWQVDDVRTIATDSPQPTSPDTPGDTEGGDAEPAG